MIKISILLTVIIIMCFLFYKIHDIDKFIDPSYLKSLYNNVNPYKKLNQEGIFSFIIEYIEELFEDDDLNI